MSPEYGACSTLPILGDIIVVTIILKEVNIIQNEIWSSQGSEDWDHNPWGCKTA
jgi:hypothetical protein